MKYICRLLWYIATRLIILSVVAGLLILAFYLSMDTSNIYLLLRDGMQQRASVILTQKNADTLTNYFTSDFLMNDETLRIGLSDQSPYVNYNVTGFTYQVSMESMWAWPWDSTATATIRMEVRVDFRPREMPPMMMVAEPVSEAAASSWVGL